MKNDRVFIKNKIINIIISPKYYWRRVIQAEREETLKKKFFKNRNLYLNKATVIISVTEPRKRSFTKKFKKSKIN